MKVDFVCLLDFWGRGLLCLYRENLLTRPSNINRQYKLVSDEFKKSKSGFAWRG